MLRIIMVDLRDIYHSQLTFIVSMLRNKINLNLATINHYSSIKSCFWFLEKYKDMLGNAESH